jgi:hypothetical protein
MSQDHKGSLDSVTSSITDTTRDSAGSVLHQCTSVAVRLAKQGRIWSAIALMLIAYGGSYLVRSSDALAYKLPFISANLAAKNLFSKPLYMYTYDSSEPEGSRVQRTLIHLYGTDNLTGDYRHLEKGGSHGTIEGFRRIAEGTIVLVYGGEDPNSDSLGSITLRQLRYASEGEAPLWIGAELGHACTCGAGMAHEGPFTTVPAVLTTNPDPPENIKAIIDAELMQPWKFKWPADVEKELEAKQAAK